MTERSYSSSEKCVKVWEKYKILARLHPIRRTGVKNHGICVAPLYQADQNVQEHSFMVAALSGILEATFEELEAYFPQHYMMTMLLHDIGETKIGDIADDGAADAVAYKDEQEYKFMEDFVEGFSADIAGSILLNFSKFQRKSDIFYLIDKLEWIFFVGNLTPSGDAGSLNYKKTHIGLTEQDKHAIEVADGSIRTVDAMVVHFMEHSHGIAGRDVFIGLIEAMYMNIDGFIPAFVGKLY